MSNLPSLSEFESRINSGSMPAMIFGHYIIKGAVGRYKQYKFVVNSDDHDPPHVHVAINDNQIAKYNLLTGECIESSNRKLDKLFADWFSHDDNRVRARQEWERFHGTVETS